MSAARLTLDVTRSFLQQRLVEVPARAKRFLELNFKEDEIRRFVLPLEEPFNFGIRRQERQLLFEVNWLEGLVHPGDRLVLTAARDWKQGRAELLDGSAVFVTHVLERSDNAFLRRIAGDIPEIEADVRVRGRRRREYWPAVRRRLIHAMVDAELQGLRAAIGLAEHLKQDGIAMAFRSEDGEDVGATEVLPAVHRYDPLDYLKLMLEEVAEVFEEQEWHALAVSLPSLVKMIEAGEPPAGEESPR